MEIVLLKGKLINHSKILKVNKYELHAIPGNYSYSLDIYRNGVLIYDDNEQIEKIYNDILKCMNYKDLNERPAINNI
jgi:hypothetical protein